MKNFEVLQQRREEYLSGQKELKSRSEALIQMSWQLQQGFFEENGGRGHWTPFFGVVYKFDLRELDLERRAGRTAVVDRKSGPGFNLTTISLVTPRRVHRNIRFNEGDDFAVGQIKGVFYHNDGATIAQNRIFCIEWATGEQTMVEIEFFAQGTEVTNGPLCGLPYLQSETDGP